MAFLQLVCLQITAFSFQGSLALGGAHFAYLDVDKPERALQVYSIFTKIQGRNPTKYLEQSIDRDQKEESYLECIQDSLKKLGIN
jgi:hypothetical protein